mgnify:FL=1
MVGVTGVMNEPSAPLFSLFRQTDVQAALAPWRGKPLSAPGELASVQAAFDTVRQALPGTTVVSVVYPGGEFGTVPASAALPEAAAE